MYIFAKKELVVNAQIINLEKVIIRRIIVLMETEEKFVWQAPEYEEKERSKDWFWALGIIVLAGSIASIIYANYFFAILLILGGILMAFFAIKKPEMIEYKLTNKGLLVKDQLYLYENIKSFYVQNTPKHLLFIKSDKIFMPMLSIPIQENMAENIHTYILAQSIPEEEMHGHPGEKIMESLGF